MVRINNSGTQGYRVWEWDKDIATKEWMLEGSHCSVCGSSLGWRWGLEDFCPRCGTMFIGTQNQEPPEDEIDEKDQGLA